MKMSLRWLQDYVNYDLPVDSLAHRLTMAGLEIEKIETVAGDTVLELEVTPNRPDCLNMVGLAREIAAILGKPLKVPEAPALPAAKNKCEISLEDKEGCLRYIGTLLENVTIAASPQWLAERISPLGLRLINNAVDVTNFCLFELGQPLHAFDYDKLIGGRIVVRRAKKGEKLVTIDGIERTLDSSILVIADAQRPVAIAGIMGGKETEVTTQTKRILLESAYFDPVLIRRAGRFLGLTSDSAYRFERGVDWPMVATGADRAVALLLEMSGGTVVARNDIALSSPKSKRPTIKMTMDAITELLGVKIPASKIQGSLKRLGFEVKPIEKNQMAVMPPSFRGDVRRDVDIIEEVARMIGYDQLPTSLPQIKFSSIPLLGKWEQKKNLRENFVGQGLNEVVTYTLISHDLLEKAQLTSLASLRVQNPLSQEQGILRPTVLPSFLSVARTNVSRGERNLRFFELGKIYPPGGEREVAAVLLAGQRSFDWRNVGKEKVDFYDLKAIFENALNALKMGEGTFAPSEEKIFVPGEGADIQWQGKKVGALGKISPMILAGWDIKQEDVYFGQIDLEGFYKVPAKRREYKPFSEYPAIVRDISIAIKQDVSYSRIKETVFAVDVANLTAVSFKEQYLGEKIPAGQRGLTFSLQFQSLQRTLTEEEVQQAHALICQALVTKLGAMLR